MAIKTALIGYGHIGKWHAQKAYQIKDCELLAIVEPFEANATKAQEDYPSIRVVSSLEEIISEIDAAIIATPTSFHFDHLKELIENKKHIFCEKPICESSVQAQELVALTKSYKGVIQVGHSERFHKAWDLIAKYDYLDQKNSLISIERQGAFKGRATDVDVVQDLMIHDIDLLLYALKQKPISVEAKGFKIRTDKWDMVEARFELESGGSARIISSRNFVKEKRELQIYNSEGSLQVDLFKNQISHAPKTMVKDNAFVEVVDYEKRDHLLEEQKCFYTSILNQSSAVVPFLEGIEVVKIIDLVLKSLEQNEKINL